MGKLNCSCSRSQKIKLTLFLLAFLGLAFRVPFARAQCDISCLNSRIAEYEAQIKNLQAQGNTLSNQIAQFNAQIKLTELKINQTEEKIALLGGRIDQLTVSLSNLNRAFSSRVVETYKITRFSSTLNLVLAAGDFGDIFSRFHYLRKIQDADRGLLSRLTQAQNTYKEEKTDQEELQEELEAQKKVLGAQKTAKDNLLASTKGEEKRYQQLLAQARAEYEAIQGIIAGKGFETEAGHVGEGQRIASIIQGASCNSSAAHVHFIVRQGNTALNPFDHLNGGVDYEDCSGSSCGSGDGDAFNPHGGWSWPISPKIRFTQGFGSTWAVRNTWVGRIYSFHNGIDINSLSSSEVKAVKSGTLYQGSYGVGCTLRYVRVDHDDSDLDTLYLHVNY